MTLLVSPAQMGETAAVPYTITFTLGSALENVLEFKSCCVFLLGGVLDVRVEDFSLPERISFLSTNPATLAISSPTSLDVAWRSKAFQTSIKLNFKGFFKGFSSVRPPFSAYA